MTAAGRFVAKLVDSLDADGLDSGLRLAEYAAARGLACGVPVRTRDGALTRPFPGGSLALLQYVPGRQPHISVPDQVRRAGRVLARAHAVTRGWPADGESRYHWPWEWVDRCLDTVAMPPEVESAARTTWREVIRTVAEHELPISIIHGDPGPDAFLLHDSEPGRDALIDWATPMRGPLLYDLASFAVCARGPAGPPDAATATGPPDAATATGPPDAATATGAAARWFAAGYAEVAPQIGPQLAHLGCLIKARWVANAIYFCSRIERGSDGGPGVATANQHGLDAAYAGMLSAV